MSIPNDRFMRGMSKYPAMQDVFDAFDSGLFRFFMLEWARRHRKTTFLINLLVRECCKVPKAKYVYVAPTQVWAREVVWDDPTMLWDALPEQAEMGWEKNEQKMTIKFANSTILKIGGADNPDSLRGIDAIGAGFDEWALHKEMVWTEVFRPIIAGKVTEDLAKAGVFRWAMFLYTPKGINHATTMFDKACLLHEGGSLPDSGYARHRRNNWFASRLDAEKVGLMTKEELDLAKEDMPPQMYDQELKCSRVTTEEMTLITSSMLYELNRYHQQVKRSKADPPRKIVSIDPGFGGDVCQLLGFIDRTPEEERAILDKHRANAIVLEGKRLAQEIGTKNFIVDAINDGGVTELLQLDEAEYNVQPFKSSHAPVEGKNVSKNKLNISFANKRAEAYFYAAEQIRKLQAGPITDQELLRQLTFASRYTVSNKGKLIIVPKLIIKKDLGCSPDKADCYVMGLYGEKNVEPETGSSTANLDYLIPDHVKVGV